MQNRKGSSTHPKIPGVDLEGSFGHGVADSHELAHHERTGRTLATRDLGNFLLAKHKLHASRVHSISEWCDESEISHGEEGVEFVLLDVLMVVVYGNKVERAVFSIDMRDQLGHLALEFG